MLNIGKCQRIIRIGQIANQKSNPGVAGAGIRNQEDIIGVNFDSSTCNGAVQDRRAYCCNIIAYAIAKRSHEAPGKQSRLLSKLLRHALVRMEND